MRVKIKHKFKNINEIINSNRTNKFGANNTKQKETELSINAFKSLPPVENYPIKLEFEWYIANKNRDLDNQSPKAIIDGMVRSGFIKDDSVKYIEKITHKYMEAKEDYVIINVIEDRFDTAWCMTHNCNACRLNGKCGSSYDLK